MWDVCHIRWTELQKVKYIMQERHSYRVWCILNGWSVAEWYQKLSRLRNFNSALQDWILHITEFWVVLNDVVKCWAFKKNEFSSCGFAPNCYSYPTVNMHCVPCDAIQPNFLNKPPAFVIQYLGNETPFPVAEPHYLTSQACSSEFLAVLVSWDIEYKWFLLPPSSTQVVLEKAAILRLKSTSVLFSCLLD